MKNIIKPLFFAFATLCLSVSCLNTSQFDGNDPNYADGHEIVTLVDGSFEVPYYVMFDNGKKAYVSQNKVASSITFPTEPVQMKGEKRVAIDYNIVNERHDGYDLSIVIVNMQDIKTDLLKDLYSESLIGKADTHTAPIQIVRASFSKKLNYLTLNMIFMQHDPNHFVHSIFLAHNKTRAGIHQNIYNSTTDVNSYLWLELYHDSNTDYETYQTEVYSSYKIDTEFLEIDDISKYKGIKIIYKPIGGQKATIYDVAIQ
jgi:hypothetical protein